LPQASLDSLLEECSLPSAEAVRLDSHNYALVERLIPQTFHELRLFLFQHRTHFLDAIHAGYLSRALAAACFGYRPLWQDLGLDNEDALLALLKTFFSPLIRKHWRCRYWKRLFFSQLPPVAGARFSSQEMLLQAVLQHQ